MGVLGRWKGEIFYQVNIPQNSRKPDPGDIRMIPW